MILGIKLEDILSVTVFEAIVLTVSKIGLSISEEADDVFAGLLT